MSPAAERRERFRTENGLPRRAWTVKEVSAQLDLDEDTVRDLIADGELYALKPGREWRIPDVALDAYLASCLPV